MMNRLSGLLRTGACLLVILAPLEAQEKPKVTARDAKLNEMQATAKSLVELRMEEYRNGSAPYLDLLTAQRQLLDIELRLVNSPGARRTVLKRQLKLAEETEKLLSAQYENGTVSQGSLLQARLARMEVEIELLSGSR